ncbi:MULTISPECIES: SulP family inorganic anion transporter [unclassified Crossiella]|uniref:SulP family inorganic anion transporter n=1 Tax=unclassified Crossiella TaxID=2620835 RepID=UPI001FFF4704|nr:MULTISPECIES: SulP family inorganic anion transporter [unclassified Crossiella]MCK2244974.1 SulP family inorganic anion transporter [Crossiella sp. S99.2]MCK2258699.1 SulP family inorganic anion transporter [Crossiella sp. S99.1]
MTRTIEPTRQHTPLLRRPGWRQTFGQDLGASLVVFLVALPLCVGVAVASGVPAELGIVTGIVGGLVVGLLPGSTMQVSGPAAGLTVLVADAVATHGIGALGLIVLGAGLLQVLLGALRCGTWFRAISPAVVQGMLAGIGLVLILGQLYPLAGATQPVSTWAKTTGLPGLVESALTTSAGLSALAVGVLTVVVMTLWQRAPRRLRTVPGVLVGVVTAAAVALAAGLDVRRIQVGNLLEQVQLPNFSLLDAGLLGSALVFALVSSAESLFSAAAVDRMHSGPRTRYNQELVAQGVGNTVCGLLGALPMTAVIVRSAANVNAGARTKASRVLHGVWLLLFAALLPGLLTYLPAAVLAALLVHAGWKLLGLRAVAAMLRTDRAEGAILVLTAGLIVSTDLLTGTLAGLLAAVLKTAWDVSHLSATVTPQGPEDEVVVLRGNATFLRLPRLLAVLEGLPLTKHVRLDLTGLRHLDQACGQAIDHWVTRHREAGLDVHVVKAE